MIQRAISDTATNADSATAELTRRTSFVGCGMQTLHHTLRPPKKPAPDSLNCHRIRAFHCSMRSDVQLHPSPAGAQGTREHKLK